MQRQRGNNVAILPGHEYRAIDGRIGITDREDGSYKTLSVREARIKLKELENEFSENRRLQKTKDYVEVRRFFDQMRSVIREAEDQGPPEEADMLAERVRRRKTQIFIPPGLGL